MDARSRLTPERLSWIGVIGLITLGGAQALAMAWPFAGNWQGQASGALQIISLAGFALMLLRCASAKQAFWTGWCFATAWLVASIWWLYISMHHYGGLPAILAALAVLLLSAGLSLLYACASWLYVRLCANHASVVQRALAFSALWLLAELVGGTLWTGFPWAAAGYAHVDSMLRDGAPWVGVYGLSALSAGLAMWGAACCSAYGVKALSWRELCSGAGLWGIAVLGMTWGTSALQHVPPQGEPTKSALSVTLLQGNVAQDLKFGAGVSMALHDYQEALLHNTADLIVTPETAVPLLPEFLPEGYWSNLEQRYTQGQQAALVGLPLRARQGPGQQSYTNSALALLPGQESALYRYDKHHLVPFGEFVPPLFRWFVDLMHIPLGDFSRGTVSQPPLMWHGERIAPNICFEDLFGEELAQSFANPATSPTVMVNLSNIAWFGDTVAIDQHLNISRMRSLELGRPMLRATNTGATAIINAQGVVTHRLPSGVQGALTAQVQGVDGPPTPYARWVSALGLWPLAFWAAMVLGWVAWQTRTTPHAVERKTSRFPP